MIILIAKLILIIIKINIIKTSKITHLKGDIFKIMTLSSVPTSKNK